jgi:hypothetical protein
MFIHLFIQDHDILLLTLGLRGETDTDLWNSGWWQMLRIVPHVQLGDVVVLHHKFLTTHDFVGLSDSFGLIRAASDYMGRQLIGTELTSDRYIKFPPEGRIGNVVLLRILPAVALSVVDPLDDPIFDELRIWATPTGPCSVEGS